jgi:hypothetical protein
MLENWLYWRECTFFSENFPFTDSTKRDLPPCCHFQWFLMLVLTDWMQQYYYYLKALLVWDLPLATDSGCLLPPYSLFLLGRRHVSWRYDSITFSRNVGNCSPKYTVSHTRERNLEADILYSENSSCITEHPVSFPFSQVSGTRYSADRLQYHSAVYFCVLDLNCTSYKNSVSNILCSMLVRGTCYWTWLWTLAAIERTEFPR